MPNMSQGLGVYTGYWNTVSSLVMEQWPVLQKELFCWVDWLMKMTGAALAERKIFSSLSLVACFSSLAYTLVTNPSVSEDSVNLKLSEKNTRNENKRNNNCSCVTWLKLLSKYVHQNMELVHCPSFG